MKDYYRILEVSPDASLEQIKEQYRLLVHAWHPDKFPNPIQKAKVEEKIKEINQAYEVLRDVTKRAQYNKERLVVLKEKEQLQKERAKEKRRWAEYQQQQKRQVEYERQQREQAEAERQRVEQARLRVEQISNEISSLKGEIARLNSQKPRLPRGWVIVLLAIGAQFIIPFLPRFFPNNEVLACLIGISVIGVGIFIMIVRHNWIYKVHQKIDQQVQYKRDRIIKLERESANLL